jgi:hypothetical protein
MAAMPDHAPPTDAEVAAALAAIDLLLEAPDVEQPDPRAGWRDATRLLTQRLRPVRVAVRPSWSTVERLRRNASDAFYGVTGL